MAGGEVEMLAILDRRMEEVGRTVAAALLLCSSWFFPDF